MDYHDPNYRILQYCISLWQYKLLLSYTIILILRIIFFRVGKKAPIIRYSITFCKERNYSKNDGHAIANKYIENPVGPAINSWPRLIFNNCMIQNLSNYSSEESGWIVCRIIEKSLDIAERIVIALHHLTSWE